MAACAGSGYPLAYNRTLIHINIYLQPRVTTSGASLAIIDANRDHGLADDLNDNDWFFEGDIAVILLRTLNLLNR
jgi:hypothetical protein